MENNRAYRSNKNNLIFRRIVYYILGTFEVLFAFRLIFKLLGASPGNTFVSMIYTVSRDFLAPFSGIFRTAVTKGVESESVLEATTIIAMLIYSLVAYGVVSLFESYEIPKDRAIR